MSGEHAYKGGNLPVREINYFASLGDVDPTTCGIGALFIGGKLYWCDGTNLTAQNDSLVVMVDAPAAADSDGVAGQIAYDATHIYVCVATDTWVRATLATWT